MGQKCDIQFKNGSQHKMMRDLLPKILEQKHTSRPVWKVQVYKSMEHECHLCEENKASLRIVRKTTAGNFYAEYVCLECLMERIGEYINEVKDAKERIEEQLKEKNGEVVTKHIL